VAADTNRPGECDYSCLPGTKLVAAVGLLRLSEDLQQYNSFASTVCAVVKGIQVDELG